MPLKQLIPHTMRHQETITAISSPIWISSKVLLSGRWQRKKILNVQHGHFLLISWNTLAASKIGTSHDFSSGTDPYWECPSYRVILMKEPVPRNKLCTGGEKPLNSTFLGGRAGWERQLLRAHKKILSHLFSQVKPKGLPNCLDTNMHLP